MQSVTWLAVSGIVTLGACTRDAPQDAALRFSAPEGRVLNEFYRDGPIAAHLVLTSGASPRLVVAFPAGNSGVAAWFDAPEQFAWRSRAEIRSAHRELADDGKLAGVSVELTAEGGPIVLRHAIASSVRVIRDYEHDGRTPPQVDVSPRVSGRAIVWQRRRLDGAPGYALAMEVTDGALSGGSGGPIVLEPGPEGHLGLVVTALTGDAPLTPIAPQRLLAATAAPDAPLRRTLAYLSYEQKLLAGSWRFLTYFGRDTLMSVRLLAPVLVPSLAEAGLGSVLERLNDAGEVAHEEDIGEFAVLRRVRAGQPPSAAPIFDYKMIDDDFMLAPVAAHYLLDTPGGAARAATFLERRTASGEPFGARLATNLRFIVTSAQPFARDPRWTNLVGLKPGEYAGNWRDSEEGLAGARYPYDVNAVLVPAALAAAARLHASGLLRPYVTPELAASLSQAEAMARTWLGEAPRLFYVALQREAARAEVESYARRSGVEPSPALTALGELASDVSFRALALDAQGRPVPVMHSDEAFALLFLEPSSEECERIATTLLMPFPAGLVTDVGLLVANPAYAPERLEPLFDRGRYHGSVIWSWHQAMLAAGIERQLSRGDLTASARAALERASATLRAVIDASRAMRGSELWSWSQADGEYRVEVFGERAQDETESNAAQLWSTVHLARP